MTEDSKAARPVNITVQLREEFTPLATTVRLIAIAAALTALPVINHHLMAGNLLMDILLMVISMTLLGVRLAAGVQGRNRVFPDHVAAAKWVAARGWETPN